MSYRVDPNLTTQMTDYGAASAVKCFNCGNCTAACMLAGQEAVFPRRYIRYIQLGLKDKMVESLDPWLCYYCGDCSQSCPREAEPGALMMASRRWLTSMYDWTGLSRLIYRNSRWELAIFVLVALLVLGLFTLPSQFGFRLLAGNPEALTTVQLQHFAPKHTVHWADLVLAGLLGGLLLSNAARMTWYVSRRGPKAPASLYLAQFKELILHFFTQKRWRGCATTPTKHWPRHLFLVTGYVTMAVLVEAFLQTFQVEDTSFHWTSLLGYYATVVLLGASVWMIYDRLKKKDLQSKHSDFTDWSFIILLFFTALSGILMHAFRRLDMPMATYVGYMVHLMIATPMLVVMVPFGKWSHLLYRPLALYLLAVQKKAAERQRSGATSPQPAVAA